MMEYLKTLGISELINFLEIESDSENFEMVGEVLSLREEKMTKHVEDLEKTVKMYKSKCSELSNSLEEAKKKGIEAEGKLEEFKGYKMVSNELKEKVSWLEGECRVISEREKIAVQNVRSLSAELVEFKRRLESVKQKAEREVGEERKRYMELEKLSELGIGKLEKDLEVYKAKCSDLGAELQEEKKKTREVESVLEEFKKYKMMSKELEEKVTRLEKDCMVVIESEKKALENVAALSGDLERMSRKRNVELGEFKRALECEKQKAEKEMKEEKKRYTELENKSKDAILKLENDLDMQRRNFSELSRALEEKEKKNIEVQSKFEELKKYEMMCGQLKDTVTCLEQKYNIVSEREKAVVENNTSLLAALDKIHRDSDAELTELKTKNKDLECAKTKAEDELKEQIEKIKELEKMKELSIEVEKDLDMYKARCSDLYTKLEEEKKHSISMEVKHEESEKYRTICNELKEKVSRLEDDCNIVSEREKGALDRIKKLTAELEKISRDKSVELDDLDRMKKLTDELKKVSLAKSAELSELKEKYRDLECAKEKAEKEVRAQKERYKKLKIQVTKVKDEIPALISKSPVPAKAKCEAGVENKEGKTDRIKQGMTKSETNESLSAATSPKLKIKLKDLSFVCDGEVRDHVSSVSVCNSAIKANNSGPVPVSTFKRKRTTKSRNSDGGSADPVGTDKVKMDHSKAMDQGPDGKKRKVECSPLRPSVTKETSNKNPGSPPVENSQEKAKAAERQSKRTIHPPNRLNL